MPPAAIGFHLFLLLNFLAQYLGTVNCQCYDLDGSIVAGDRPCYQDQPHSFCCGDKWTCVSPGICSRENSTEIAPNGGAPLQRATCTDKTWKSNQCPQFCKNEGRPRGMKECDESYSTFCCVFTDCCGGPQGRQCLDEGTPCRPQSSGFVDLHKNAVPLTTIGTTGSEQTSTSTSKSVSMTPVSSSITLTTESPTGTSRSDPVAAPSSKRSSPVGLIAGFSVAATVSITGAALALLWWKRRRAEIQNNKRNNSLEPLTQSYHHQVQGAEPTDRSNLGFAPSELSSLNLNLNRHKSQSTILVEAPPSDNGPQELPTRFFDASELPGSQMGKS